jgi:hypothetical protein
LSDEAVAALIGVGGTVVGVVVASVFNLASSILNRRFTVEDREADRREWYRRTLFEKRLDTIQDGYHWLMQLNRATSQPEARAQGSEQNRTVAELSQQARKWYDANCVFMEDAVPSSSNFIGALNAAGTDLFWKMCIDAERDLRVHLRELLESERQFKSKRGQEKHDE